MKDDSKIFDVPRIPSHSQATELCVQVVKNIVRKYPGTKSQEERAKTICAQFKPAIFIWSTNEGRLPVLWRKIINSIQLNGKKKLLAY